MNRVKRSCVVAWTLAIGMLGACATISGLESYSTDNCPGECDASIAPANRGREAAASDNAGNVTQDEASGSQVDALVEGEDGEDANESADVQEAADSGGVPDTGVVDSGEAADAPACGFACKTGTGNPSCNGTTCSYTCNSNRQDCNSATAPDTDGCECTGTACCGTACQTAHNSGLTSPTGYYACSPTGNTTQTQALAACSGSGGTGCAGKNASCGGILGFGGTSTSAACGTVAGTCYCWVYSGQNSGQVHASGSGCTIACTSGSAWN